MAGLPTTDEALKAAADLREATQEAHRARRDLAQLIKAQRDEVRKAVEVEVARQVDDIASQIRQRLVTGAEAMLAGIERDWREKLGLPDR